MYQLAITRDFIAQHYLTGGDWGKENEKHSHHYRIEVIVEAEQLNQHGYLIDIVDLDEAITAILATYQERTLNDLHAFKGLNPSLERFAQIIWDNLYQRLGLERTTLTVKLWENEQDWAAFRFSA